MVGLSYNYLITLSCAEQSVDCTSIAFSRRPWDLLKGFRGPWISLSGWPLWYCFLFFFFWGGGGDLPGQEILLRPVTGM